MSEDSPHRAVDAVAIAGAIKQSAITKYKSQLPRGQSIPVDIFVRIKGTVQIGHDTPPSSGESEAKVSLHNAAIYSEVLRRLKIEPATLQKTLRAIVRSGYDKPYDERDYNRELLRVIDKVGDDVAKKLPPVPWSSAGRSAPVSVTADARVMDQSQQKAA